MRGEVLQGHLAAEGPNEFGCGTTASTQECGARYTKLFSRGSEFLRRQFVRRNSRNQFWQSGIGFNPDWKCRSFREAAANRKRLSYTDTTIRADGVNTFTHKRRRHLLRRAPHHGAILVFTGIENERHEDRQASSERSRSGDTCLFYVCHCLDKDGIRIFSGEGHSLLQEGVTQLLSGY